MPAFAGCEMIQTFLLFLVQSQVSSCNLFRLLFQLVIQKDQPLLLTSITAAFIPSSIVSNIFVLEPFNISFDLSASAPDILAKTGTSITLFSYALMKAVATVVVLTIPPYRFTSIPFTFLILLIKVKASYTVSVVAPPPTSKKQAGLPPWSDNISRVDMTRPAPFPTTAIFPSSSTRENPLFSARSSSSETSWNLRNSSCLNIALSSIITLPSKARRESSFRTASG